MCEGREEVGGGREVGEEGGASGSEGQEYAWLNDP